MTARENTIEIIEKILEQTHKESITVTIPRLAAEQAVSLLKEQKAVVHCKDCENGAYVAAPGMLPFVKCGGIDHELDWFCADGKRR